MTSLDLEEVLEADALKAKLKAAGSRQRKHNTVLWNQNMNAENLTYEQKKELAGKCNFFLISIFSTAAFFCSLSSTSWCDFVARNIQLVDSVDSVASACQELNLTSVTCNAFLDKHAVGLYAWQATVPVNQVVCLSYTQAIENVGWVTPDFDSKFHAVQAFSVIANVFGGFAFFTLALASCCPLSQQRLNGLSCFFSIATLFQGLTLLVFKSDICSKYVLYSCGKMC